MPRKRDEGSLVERLDEGSFVERSDRLGILAQLEFWLLRIAAASVAVLPFWDVETGSDIKRPSRFFLLVTYLRRKGRRKCLY
jgi:hypothetical protein